MGNRNSLWLILAACLVFGFSPVPAQDFHSGRIDSFLPTDVGIGQTTYHQLKITNTGVGGFFAAEIIQSPGGWTISPRKTNRALVFHDDSYYFDFSITTPPETLPIPYEITIRLYDYETDIIEEFSDQVVVTVQPTYPPGSFDLVSPANFASGVTQPINFRWQGSSYSTSYTLDFYVEEAGYPAEEPFLTVENLTSVNYQLTTDVIEIPPGYFIYWDVTAKNALGEIKSTTGPWLFQTELRDPPTSFQFITPAEDGMIFSTVPRFEWTASANTVLYYLEVFPDRNGSPFEPAIFAEEIEERTFYQFTEELSPGAYHVLVSAFNENFGQQVDGGPRPFFVSSLGPFEKGVPAPGAANVSRKPVFQWSESTTAHSYRLELDIETTAGFQTHATVIVENAGTTYQWDRPPLPPDATLQWRLAALGYGEERYDESGWSKFSTTPLGDFSVHYPLVDDVDVSREPVFSWQVAVGADEYQIVLYPSLDGAPDPAGDKIESARLSGSATSWNWNLAEPLEAGEEYVYRVRAYDTGSDAMELNREGWVRFTTTGLVPFGLLSPSNGASGQPLAPAFQWEPVPGAIRYRLHLESSLGTVGSIETPNNIPSIVLPDTVQLNGETTYSWTVEAIGIESTLFAEDTFTFTTAARTEADREDLLDALLGGQRLSDAEREALGLAPDSVLHISDLIPYETD